MAGWRQAVALAMTGEEIEALIALSRSRTEPAGRVSRAAMLLGYREKPSFFAVGRRLGVHHQTVQRCVERAMAYGRACGTLDDRPRPGKEPTITPEAKAWLVSLACDKAKEHGYPHELWTTRLLARQRARARTGGGSPMVSPVWLKAPCASFSVKRKSSRTRCATIWNAATPSSTPKDGGSSVCLPRGPGPEKSRCQGGEIEEAGRDRLLRREAWNPRPSPMRRAPDLPPVPGRHASFARDHEYKRHGTLSLKLAGIDLLTGKVHALVRRAVATAAASSSNSSSFSMPPIRPAPRSS